MNLFKKCKIFRIFILHLWCRNQLVFFFPVFFCKFSYMMIKNNAYTYDSRASVVVFGCWRKVPIVSKVKKLWEYWLCCHLLQSAALCWLCQCPFYDICLTNVVVWKKEEDEITHTICLTNVVVWKKEEDDEITHTICLTNLVVNLVVREGRWWDHSHNLFDKFGCERKEDDEITHTLVCLFSFPISAKLSNYWLICQCVLYFTLLYLWTSQYPPPVHPTSEGWMNEWMISDQQNKFSVGFQFPS